MSDDQKAGPQKELEELDQLPADPQDRAEAEWLLARERGEIDVAPPSAQLAQEHGELAELLGTLPVGKPDRSWQADVLRLIDEAEGRKASEAASETSSAPSEAATPAGTAETPDSTPAPTVTPAAQAPVIPLAWWRRSAVRITAAGATAAAAAVAVLLLRSSPSGAPHAELKLDITLLSATASRGASYSPGKLWVTSDYRIELKYPREAELRIFAKYPHKKDDGALVAMCAGDNASCQIASARNPSLEFRPTSAGEYVAIAIEGKSSLLPDASLKAFRQAARAADKVLVEQSFEAH